MVALADGTQVKSDSREWLLECEARYVLNLPTKADRHALLDKIEKRRGRAARVELSDRILALYFLQQGKAKREQETG
jgi:hypothetical protein